MARLPTPGEDDGTWGEILNDFLSVEHNPDGTLKDTGTLASKADDAAVVHNSGAETIAGAKTFQTPPIVPTPMQGGQAANKTYVDAATSSANPLASLIPSEDDVLQYKNSVWTNRSPSQLKTDMALTKSDVGLTNVDNTSDSNKPISTATQAALSAKTPNVQLFTADSTWTKPANAVLVEITVVGGGGGGGSGRRGAAGTVRGGGAGGSGGAITHLRIPANAVGATVAVTVGLGAAGGTGRTTDNTNGSTTQNGGTSFFGLLVRAGGGGGGNGGTTTGGTIAAGGTGGIDGGLGGGAPSSGGTGNPAPAATGPTGGGGGGGIAANEVASGGGMSNGSYMSLLGSAQGGNGIIPAANGASQPTGSGLPGTGGGGGGAQSGGAQAGGNGGLYGAGGGGGAASTNGTTSGAGGNGASGIVIVTTYF